MTRIFYYRPSLLRRQWNRAGRRNEKVKLEKKERQRDNNCFFKQILQELEKSKDVTESTGDTPRVLYARQLKKHCQKCLSMFFLLHFLIRSIDRVNCQHRRIFALRQCCQTVKYVRKDVRRLEKSLHQKKEILHASIRSKMYAV